MIEQISPLRLIQTLSLHFPCLVLLLVTSPHSYAHPFLQRDTSLKPFSYFFPCLFSTYGIYVITHPLLASLPLSAFAPVYRIISQIIFFRIPLLYLVEAENGK